MALFGAQRALFTQQQIGPTAQLWGKSVAANGGTVSGKQYAAVNNLALRLRLSTAWPNIDDMWLLGAESSIQTLTSFKQRRLGTAVNSPVFTRRGVQFTGASSQYINTGFIAGTHGVAMTGTNMQGGIYTNGNFGTSTAGFAAQNASANQSIYLEPRSGGGSGVAQLNCSATTFGAIADSTGLISFYRNGSTYGSRRNGAAVATNTPGANSTVLTTVAAYIGARNNNGTADLFYTGLMSCIFIGADITIAAEPAVYTAIQQYLLDIGAFDTYVSTTSGSDSNVGDINHPYLTWTKGITNTNPVAGLPMTMWLDGTVGSPQTYQSATTSTLNKGITVRAINPRGAIITSASATTALAIQPVAGETISLRDVIVDAAVVGTGATLTVLTLTSQATPYTLNCTNVLFRGWTGAASAYGVYTNAVNFLGTLNFSHCDFTSATCLGPISLFQLTGNSAVTIDSCTFTITEQTTTNFAAIHVQAKAIGPTVRITNNTVNFAPTVAAGSSIFLGILVRNMPGYVAYNTVNCTGPASNRSAYCIAVQTDTAGTEMPTSGSIVEYNTITSTLGAGSAGVIMGTDGISDRTLQVGNIVRYNTYTSDVNGAGLGVHAYLMGEQTDGYCGYNTANMVGLMGDKNSLRSTFEYNTVNTFYKYGILVKGSTNSIVRNNTLNQGAGPTIALCSGCVQDTGGTNVDATGIQFSTNTYTNNGATTLQWANVDGTCTGTFDHNSYQQVSGSINTIPFVYQGNNYATFADWKAAQEPTGTANFP